MPFCEAMEFMFEIRKVEADGNLIADVEVSGKDARRKYWATRVQILLSSDLVGNKHMSMLLDRAVFV